MQSGATQSQAAAPTPGDKLISWAKAAPAEPNWDRPTGAGELAAGGRKGRELAS